MRRSILIALLLLFGLGAFWIYRKLFPPDEVVIRRTLRDAAAAVSVRADGSGLDKLAAVNRLVNLCTADITVEVDAPGMRARVLQGVDQLREAAAAVQGSSKGLQVRLVDISVELAENRVQAASQFIARARTADSADELVQEFRVTLNRAEGPWKIQRVEPLRSLVFPEGTPQ